MNLQNGYKVIYEKIANGKRTFYATKNVKCDPTVDDKIVEATIGEYKLIYERDGRFFGSLTGIPSTEDYCFENFDKVFKVDNTDATSATATPAMADVPTEVEQPVETTEVIPEEPVIDEGNDEDEEV